VPTCLFVTRNRSRCSANALIKKHLAKLEKMIFPNISAGACKVRRRYLAKSLTTSLIGQRWGRYHYNQDAHKLTHGRSMHQAARELNNQSYIFHLGNITHFSSGQDLNPGSYPLTLIERRCETTKSPVEALRIRCPIQGIEPKPFLRPRPARRDIYSHALPPMQQAAASSQPISRASESEKPESIPIP
jgi:hypothetical protein